MRKITCFGEVLWDVFPTHEKIGGAPLNVAIRLQSLNNDASIISRVGKDKRGEKLLKFIKKHNVTSDYVQLDPELNTGKVEVTIDEKGSASYKIMSPRAWDRIEATEEAIDLVQDSDAFVYGSLIARDDVSKNSLFKCLKHARFKIFDVNLRTPFYTETLLTDLMNKADFIKFNDEELFEICNFLGSKYKGLEQNIHFIAEKTNTKNICVTKGAHGAVLLYNNQLYYNSGYQINIVDTVGAGDSFLASLISQLLNKTEPQDAIDFACAAGALVAQSAGANPVITKEDINNFINPI